MTPIKLQKPTNAPGCFAILNTETGEDILIQTDWDYPGVASTFGWATPCECGESDGTVDCRCGTASEFVAKASEYLWDNTGAVADDPGYF